MSTGNGTPGDGRTGSDGHAVPASVLPALDAAGVLAAAGEGDPADDPQYLMDIERTVGLLASTLARLHSIDPVDLVGVDESHPVTELGPADLVARARAALQQGRIRADGLDDAYHHVEPARLVEILETTRGTSLRGDPPPRVLTHGRPTLSALRCRDGAALGFSEWDRLALADPYRDLAVAARSIASRLGSMLVPALFDRYAQECVTLGAEEPGAPDALRLDWYAMAAELDP